MEVNKTEIAQYVVQMQNGDGQAFEKLYNATNQSGYFTALKILKDEDEAQDVLQDSYVTVLEKINDIRDPESFVSWFHQIVANRAKKYLAKKRPSLFASEDEEQEYTEFIPDEDEIWQPEKSVDEDDVRRQVMEIVEGLTDEKRACVILYYYNEMSVADIAQTVGASENTVKARLFQARKDIRKEVEKLGKKNIALRGVAPVSLLLWALRMASRSDGAKFAAGPAAAAVMEGAVAAVSSGAAGAAGTAAIAGTAAAAAETAAAGAAQTAAVGGGIAAKVAAFTVTQKIIAVVAGVGVFAGAAAGTAAVVKNLHKKDDAAQAAVQTQETPTQQVLEELLEETTTEVLTQEETTEPATEPTATTARVEVQSETAASTSAQASVSASAATTSAVSTTKERVTGFTTPSTSATTKKETTAKATTTKAPQTEKTTAEKTTTTVPASNPPQQTAAPTTEPTTEKTKGTATVTIKYTVPGYESDSIPLTVTEGDAITWDMIDNAVRNKLSGTYTIYDIDHRSGDPVSVAEPTTYIFTVIVDADEI